MSTSQHPVALRLETLVGGDARLLALVMMLPLVDGIFPAMILAGAVNDPWGAVQVGLLIFGGSATVAVMLAEMSGTPREQVKVVLFVGIPLILLAAVQAALAPAIDTVLNTAIFERFAAVVILAIAAKTASATIGEYLPSPGVIVGLGLVASLEPAGATFVVMDDPALVANATLAAVVGVAFALSVALTGPYLREHMDIDRFRFGSAVALGLLPLSLVGMAFGQAPLAALVVAAVFAIDFARGDDARESAAETTPVGVSPLTDGGGAEGRRLERSAGVTTASEATAAEQPTEQTDDEGPYPGDDTTDTEGRAPWL